MLNTPRQQLKIAAVLLPVVAVTAVLTGVLTGVSEKFDSEDHCFQYDTAYDDSVYCGTTEQIENQFRDAGRDWAAAGYGVVSDPVRICVARSVVQANMNSWPEQYRAAFEEGCRSWPGVE